MVPVALTAPSEESDATTLDAAPPALVARVPVPPKKAAWSSPPGAVRPSPPRPTARTSDAPPAAAMKKPSAPPPLPPAARATPSAGVKKITPKSVEILPGPELELSAPLRPRAITIARTAWFFVVFAALAALGGLRRDVPRLAAHAVARMRAEWLRAALRARA